MRNFKVDKALLGKGAFKMQQAGSKLAVGYETRGRGAGATYLAISEGHASMGSCSTCEEILKDVLC